MLAPAPCIDAGVHDAHRVSKTAGEAACSQNIARLQTNTKPQPTKSRLRHLTRTVRRVQDTTALMTAMVAECGPYPKIGPTAASDKPGACHELVRARDAPFTPFL